MKKLWLFTAFVTISLSSCAKTQHPRTTQINAVYGDSRIGSYVSSWQGFRTSSYWIEGPSGLILIDTQFLLSASEDSLNLAEEVTGKKVKLAIVLHPNPDKFNGTKILQDRGIPVVTSSQVREKIPSVHELRKTWFYERFKPDYPETLALPDSFGDQPTILNAAGLKVKAHILGAGCSDTHVVIEFENHLFVGDLITQGFHSWLELGYLDEWIDRMNELKKIDAKYVHSGRGGSGDTDLIDRQKGYLEKVRTIILSHQRRYGLRLNDKIEKSILHDIITAYPAYDYPLFVENGIATSWQRLAQKKHSDT